MTTAVSTQNDPADDSPVVTGALELPGSPASLDHRVLRAIENLTCQSGRPPTYREVLAYTGIRSHRRLSEGLHELVRAGRLARLSGSRNLIVVRQVCPTAP